MLFFSKVRSKYFKESRNIKGSHADKLFKVIINRFNYKTLNLDSKLEAIFSYIIIFVK